MKAPCRWCGRTVTLTQRGQLSDHRVSVNPLSGQCPTAGMRPTDLRFLAVGEGRDSVLPHRGETRHAELMGRPTAHVRTMMGERR